MKITSNGFGQRRYRTRLKYRCGWPELTALADILFLSLLFFVIASSFVRVSGIKVDLPRVDTRSSEALERFVVSLTPSEGGDGAGVNIYFREKRCGSIGDLQQELAELHRHSVGAKVIIRADRNVPFEEVARIMDAAKSENLSCFIAVKVPEEDVSAPFVK